MAPDPQDALFDTRRTLHLSFADQGTCKTARSKITRSFSFASYAPTVDLRVAVPQARFLSLSQSGQVILSRAGVAANAVVLWRFLYFKLLANSSVLSSGGDPRELLSVSKKT